MDSAPPVHAREVYDVLFRVITSKQLTDATPSEVKGILTTAFSDRAKQIDAWVDKRLMVGVNMNVTCDFERRIDRGPHPKSKEAPAFREFWGDKSSLRKFADGSLLESLEWGSDPLCELAQYALQRHFSSDAQIEFAPRDMSGIFALCGHSTGSSDAAPVYDELVTVLRSLDLTVGIVSVSAVSPYLRGTAVFPYEQLNAKSGYASLAPPAIRVLVKLESSKAWPMELTPLLQFKIAVYIEMAKLLNAKGVAAKPHYEGVQVLFHGFAFELEAFHGDELAHFAGTAHGERVLLHDKVLVVHHSYVSALCTRFASFGGAVRAAVRWVRAKGVMSEALPHEAVELMVAHVYTSGKAPTNMYSGFLRFLQLLASKKRTFCINDVTPASDAMELPIVVAASHCLHSDFTRSPSLTKSVVQFLRLAAIQSLRFALENEYIPLERNLPRIFAIPTNHWKVKFFIDTSVLPHNEYNIMHPKRKAGRFELKTKVPPELNDLYIDFNPVLSLLKELNARFGTMLNFWYDELGGIAIGVSYSDDLLNSMPLKEENLQFAMLNDAGDVSIDMESVKQQIIIMGSGIIKSFQVV